MKKIFRLIFTLSLVSLNNHIQASLQESLVEQVMIHPATKRIDFGFVLLTNDEETSRIKRFSQKVTNEFKFLSNQEGEKKLSDIVGNYKNIPLTIPHISLGQYSCLALEIDKLKSISDKIAAKYSILEESMQSHLTVTNENIFWTTLKTKKETNPVLIRMYIDFREKYFESIITKQPIAQMLYEKTQNTDNKKELDVMGKMKQEDPKMLERLQNRFEITQNKLKGLEY